MHSCFNKRKIQLVLTLNRLKKSLSCHFRTEVNSWTSLPPCDCGLCSLTLAVRPVLFLVGKALTMTIRLCLSIRLFFHHFWPYLQHYWLKFSLESLQSLAKQNPPNSQWSHFLLASSSESHWNLIKSQLQHLHGFSFFLLFAILCSKQASVKSWKNEMIFFYLNIYPAGIRGRKLNTFYDERTVSQVSL